MTLLRSSASWKVGLARQLLELHNLFFDDNEVIGDASAKPFGESIVMSVRGSPDGLKQARDQPG